MLSQAVCISLFVDYKQLQNFSTFVSALNKISEAF